MIEVETLAKAYRQTGWDLKELVSDPSPEALKALVSDLEARAEALVHRRVELTEAMDPALFHDFLRCYEDLQERMQILDAYGYLRFAANTQSDEALSLKNKVNQLVTELDNKVLFFELWWKGLPEEAAERLLPSEEDDSDSRHFLEERRRWRPFTLAEDSERIINIKDANGVGGLVTLYSILTNRLEFEIEVDGETQSLTRDALMSHAFSPDPALRAAAYDELYRVFSKEATPLSQIYIHRVRDWHSENVLERGFDSPIAVRNLHNDVPEAAIEALLAATRENRHHFHRFFRLKAKWLGMDRLRRCDLYAPLVESSRQIAWDEAVQKVLTTFRDFHPTLGTLAERVFEEGHIDSEVRKGKRGGAFCSTVGPRFTPWVLVNFTGRPRDVAEIAHELGHAVHSMLAEKHSLLTQHPCLPLAETASVFAEMLVMENLLAQEKDPATRRDLLAKNVIDIFATVTRQTYFVGFEIEAHKAILEGKSQTELDALYMSNLEEQFGDSVELSPEFRQEWITIPHIFHTPFYCYAYSFGQLLVLSLYRRFQEEGEAFKPGYLRMLSHGGSKRTQDILQEAGIDITDPEFWQSGFEVVKDMVDELEALDL